MQSLSHNLSNRVNSGGPAKLELISVHCSDLEPVPYLEMILLISSLLLILIITSFVWRKWKILVSLGLKIPVQVLDLAEIRYCQAQRQTEDTFGAQHGCLPMRAHTQGKLPFAVDLVKRLWDANQDQRLLAFQQDFIEDLGPNLEQRLLGDVGLVTLDPENVKTILSKSKFRPGELGSSLSQGHTLLTQSRLMLG